MISCPHCSRSFKGSRISPRHIGSCPNWPRTLTKPCLCGFQATSDNKAHQAAQLKKMLARHGVAALKARLNLVEGATLMWERVLRPRFLDVPKVLSPYD